MTFRYARGALLLTTGLLTTGLMVLAGPASAQQAYPVRPIRIISPYAPGGGNTIMARLVGQKLTEAWGQQVIVDNRPGGTCRRSTPRHPGTSR